MLNNENRANPIFFMWSSGDKTFCVLHLLYKDRHTISVHGKEYAIYFITLLQWRVLRGKLNSFMTFAIKNKFGFLAMKSNILQLLVIWKCCNETDK